MTGLRTGVRVLRHQAGHLRRVLSGRRPVVPSFGSKTLDASDAALAREWLDHRARWRDPGIVEEFERAFAAWNGSRHAFAFMGGRVALSACVQAAGPRPGDEALLPGYTCVVVPNAFDYAGVPVRYADIEIDTYGLDAASVRAALTPRTRFLLVQHLYGLVARDFEDLLDLARERDLTLIEDCAHATGALWKKARVGTFGRMGFYSLEQSKVLTTVQGGVAVTDDDTLAARMAAFRDEAPFPSDRRIEDLLHTLLLNYERFKRPGSWWRGDLAELRYGRREVISTTSGEERGDRPSHYGQRMPAPLAAIGLHQLRKVDAYNALRRERAGRWEAWCRERGLPVPTVVPDSTPVFVRYPTRVSPEKKRDTRWFRRETGLELGKWYVSNIHPTPRPVAGCPRADEASATVVNLPTLVEESVESGRS